MSYAVLSCDLDTVDRHLQGYGVEDLPPCDAIYKTAVPRLLELLDELQLRAVFFFIARDAPKQRELLRMIAAAGHEVASHSLTHPQPFRTLSDEDLRQETAESRRLLSEAVGEEVVGFRTPAWDMDDRVLSAVADAGYRYDASSFPSPALILSRLSVYSRSEKKAEIFQMSLLRQILGRRGPHALGQGAGSALFEFPAAVTRWLRMPVYHTLRYLTPTWLFERNLRVALAGPTPLAYEFHAADLLDLERDGVDPRMERHPGMKISADEKRGQLRDVFKKISAARRIVTYREALLEETASAAAVA